MVVVPPAVPVVEVVVAGEVGLHRPGVVPEEAEEACYSPVPSNP